MSDYLLVAAIDFGTTYSGYAFSTLSDFKLDPLKIHANQAWNAGGRQLLSLKTPTCLLLDEEKRLVSFGYEAENDYAELVLDEKHHDHYYFSRFKMKLYKAKESMESMCIEDISGKSMSAMDVFSKAIKALKDHLLTSLTSVGTMVKSEEIKWVLTVPAIWPDKAKQFMRTSAIQAGIDDEQLLIALEPEAASIYCQYVPTEKGSPEAFVMTDTGQQYMVIDLGGGTVDITVHEKQAGGHLKELCRASGNDCGGTTVDNAFIQMIKKILGAPLVNMLKKEDPTAFLDLLREFETVKRRILKTSSGKVNLTIPCATINSLCEKYQNETLKSMIESSPFAEDISLRGDKLRIDADVMKSLYNKTIDSIIELIHETLQHPAAKKVTLLLLVGGFAECPLIQARMMKEFSSIRVVIPDEAGLSVLKGAVLFGHKPDYIISRVMRFTYGTDVTKEFDPAEYPESRKVIIKKRPYCNTIFATFMERDKAVPIGTKVHKVYQTICPYQADLGLNIFASENKSPKYIDEDGCQLIGNATIEIPCPTEEIRDVKVEFTFGNTEITIAAKETLSGNICEAKIKLI